MKKLFILLAAMLTFTSTAFAQLGSLSSDLVFTPLTPCRIVDTRVAGGTIPAGTARGFKAWGASFAAQGGSATNCGIPQNTNVAALELNLVVVGTAADGYITAYPFGVTQPLASTLNYLAGAVLANGATVKVSQSSLAFDWNLFTLATTHFLADVTGYYSRPISTGSFECVDTAAGTAIGAAGGGAAFATAPACPATYVATSVQCTSTSFDMPTVSSNPNGNCTAKNNGASPATLSAYHKCCRIPGR